jgi:hypothetical protein
VRHFYVAIAAIDLTAQTSVAEHRMKNRPLGLFNAMGDIR